MGHLRKAATHAAGGVGATVGPRYGSARDQALGKVSSARGLVGPGTSRVTGAASQGWNSTIAAFAPLMDAARQGSAQAGKLPAMHGRGRPRRDKVKVSLKADTETGHRGTIIGLVIAGVTIGTTGALIARRRNRARWAEYEPSTVSADANALLDKTRSAMDKNRSRDPENPDDMSGTASKIVSWCREHASTAVGTVRHRIHEATAEPEERRGQMKAKDHPGEGPSHLADKTEARLNDAATRRGPVTKPAESMNQPPAMNQSPGMNQSPAAMGNPADPMRKTGDEVDDLLRSSKNGRM